jgi:hypothetical protein
LSRRAVLEGLGGLATAAGISGLRFAGSRTGEERLARSAYLDGPMKARVTVDLGHPTGKWVQPHIYGYATGDLNNNDWLLAANGVVESSAEILAPPLIRFNTSESSIIQSVFTNGVGQPDWTHLARWEQYHSDFLGSNGRLVFGLGPNDADTSLPPAIWSPTGRSATNATSWGSGSIRGTSTRWPTPCTR